MATVFMHDDYRPGRGWEPEIEPLCWKVAVSQSDQHGFYNGLTVRGWHRENYRDTVYVGNASREPALLALSMASVVDGECESETEIADREQRDASGPADELVAALRRVLPGR